MISFWLSLKELTCCSDKENLEIVKWHRYYLITFQFNEISLLLRMKQFVYSEIS